MPELTIEDPDSMQAPVNQEASDTTQNLEVDDALFSERLERSLDTCEFSVSPEIGEALEGFYSDHYALADSINDRAIGESSEKTPGQIQDESETGVDYEKIFSRALRRDSLASDRMPSATSAREYLEYCSARTGELIEEGEMNTEEAEALVAEVLMDSCEALFTESSVGISTVEENDMNLAHSLIEKVSAQILNNPNASDQQKKRAEKLKINYDKNFAKAKEEFWADTRMAGQLLVHTTSNLDDIYRNGAALLPRTEQERIHGKVNRETASSETSGSQHTNVPHFSERYVSSTRGIDQRTRGHREGAGVILIPIGSVVEQAPYARDAKYSVESMKVPELTEHIASPDQDSGRIDEHSIDEPGKTGDDRVFFASPNETSDVAPEEYAIKLDGTSSVIRINGQEGEVNEAYGRGQNLPKLVGAETQESSIDAFRKIQESAMQDPKYAGKVVVPLRRGVFTYSHEGTAGNSANASDGVRPRRVAETSV